MHRSVYERFDMAEVAMTEYRPVTLANHLDFKGYPGQTESRRYCQDGGLRLPMDPRPLCGSLEIWRKSLLDTSQAVPILRSAI
jgi:hypothetical protein